MPETAAALSPPRRSLTTVNSVSGNTVTARRRTPCICAGVGRVAWLIGAQPVANTIIAVQAIRAARRRNLREERAPTRAATPLTLAVATEEAVFRPGFPI